MRNITITLGGEEREFPELPSRKAAAWRELAKEPLNQIVDAIKMGREIEIENTTDLVNLIEDFKPLLLESVDTIRDLVIAYTEVDREWALDNTYDSEYLEAIVPIMRMGYPYDFLVRKVTQVGAAQSRILMNGRSQSTANGQTSSMKSSSPNSPNHG